VIVNQRDPKNNGWVYLGAIWKAPGKRVFLKVDNSLVDSGKYLYAESALLMLNRKRSSDAVVTDTKEETPERIAPADFVLHQNFPNPFNPVTSIKYRTSSPALLLRKEKGAESPSPSEGEGFRVRLVVFDVLGREIAILVNEEQSPGAYTVEFNASSLPSGTYFYELRAGGFREVKKMILLR
jgi:hypothetical protein